MAPERISAAKAWVAAKAEELDVLRFEQLLGRARRILPTDPREAVTSLEEALALWSGSPLSDLSEAASLTGEIARLNELRVSAVEDLLGAHEAGRDCRTGKRGGSHYS